MLGEEFVEGEPVWSYRGEQQGPRENVWRAYRRMEQLLEELRGRLILALGGLFAAVLVCLLFSERIMIFLCKPLNSQLARHGLPQEMHYTSLTDPFMTYLKVTMIAAAAIAEPRWPPSAKRSMRREIRLASSS